MIVVVEYCVCVCVTDSHLDWFTKRHLFKKQRIQYQTELLHGSSLYLFISDAMRILSNLQK